MSSIKKKNNPAIHSWDRPTKVATDVIPLKDTMAEEIKAKPMPTNQVQRITF
jgi:hypothetical protein